MSKYTIMLSCAAGMSTSMLVSKMKEAAKNKNIDADIFAVPAGNALSQLDSKTIDCVLLGKKQGKISYDNLSDAADLVFYWQIGLEEIMLSTNVPMESLYSQIDLMKNMILSGHLD